MEYSESKTGQLNWLLDDLINRVVGADRSIVLSSDGLLIGRSSNLDKDDADHLAAVASAFQSLARGAGRHFGGGAVRQTIVEMDNAFLVVTASGRGSCLALLAAPDADLGMVGYEMNMMVKRVGAVISPGPRTAVVGAHDQLRRSP